MTIAHKIAEVAPPEAVEGLAKPSVCIVSPKAYGAMCGGKQGHIGGIEWQTTLLAKWLAQRQYRTTMITWDEGGAQETLIDGVRLLKTCRQQAGIKGLRFIHPKWTSLTQAMRQADADVYYQNGAECTTGQVAVWCRQNGRSFVFSTANDTDCDPLLPQLRTPWVRWLYRCGLRWADVRIVQTARQRGLLNHSFGQDSVVIPMPCPDAVPNASHQAADEAKRRVLWIARICRQKRPDRLLDLAAACPEIAFDMVGPFSSDPYSEGIRQRA